MPGPLSLAITGRNATGENVAYGETTVVVVAGSVATATATVRPFVGLGWLFLDISWPDEAVVTPVIEVDLDRDGVVAPLTCELALDGLSAFFPRIAYPDDSLLASGYYLMIIRMYDGDVSVWDHVEAVRIIYDETTSGVYELGTIYPDTGDLQVLVQADMQNPIAIAFSGDQTSIIPDSDMTVTASTSQPVGSYQWYLNGDPLVGETQETTTIGSDLDIGFYRLYLVVTRGSVVCSDGIQFEVAGVAETVWGDTRVISDASYAGESVSMAVDTDGFVHVTWEENDDTGVDNLAYATNRNQQWPRLGPGAPPGEANTILDAAISIDRNPGIAIGSDGEIHICYFNSVDHAVLYYHKGVDDVDWPVSSETVTEGTYVWGTYGAIAVDSLTGVVHTAYEDGPGDLYHAHNTGGVWHTEPAEIDAELLIGRFGKSIAVYSDGYSHISYFDDTNDQLRYATDASGSWEALVVDNGGSVGDPSDLALDALGAVHIAYYDSGGQGNLKYASNASGPGKPKPSWSAHSAVSGPTALWL